VAFSVLASSFPNTREKVFGYAETASGIGLLVGPILGEFMNNKMGGYLPSFLAFAAMEVIIGLMSAFLLPASLNRKPVISNEEFKKLDSDSEIKVQTSWFFKNRRVIFTLFSLTMINYFVNFKQAILGPYIEESRTSYVEHLGKIVAIAPMF